MKTFKEYITEAATKEPPTAAQAHDELEKMAPYSTINSSLKEKQFLTKAKKYFAKNGVEGWKVDMAVKDLRKANAGRTIVYIDPVALVRQLVTSKDLINK